MSKIQIIEKDVPVFSSVQVGTEKKKMFRCTDGYETLDEGIANQHEQYYQNKLKIDTVTNAFNKIEQLSVDDDIAQLCNNAYYCNDIILSCWMKFKSIKEVDDFMNYMKEIYPRLFKKIKAKDIECCSLNEWVLVLSTEDASEGFFNGDFSVIKKTDVKKRIQKMMDNLDTF